MGPNNFDYGCNTSCISSRDVMEGVCMGKGCCQKRIPKGLKYYNTTMTSKGNHTNVFSFSKCGYAFLGEVDNYHFQGFKDLSDDNFIDRIRATVPIVLDWAIGTDTCMQAQNSEDYACRENSQCVDADFHGYRCICKPGFQGNPYLTPGCQRANFTKIGCPKQCGNVTVPYPFGIGSGCAFDSGFALDCNTSRDGYAKLPFIGNIEVYNISDAELRISNVISWRCYNSNGSVRAEDQHGWTHLGNSTYPYSFSIRNKFIVVGCDDNALITRHNFQIYCSTSCNGLRDVTDRQLTGNGLYEVQIPKGLKYSKPSISSTQNHIGVWHFNQCGYAFSGEADQFHFGGLQDLSDITFYDRIKASVPIVLDWAIGNFCCKKAQDRKDYACKQNCHCVDSDTGLGWYRCSCNKAYEGNPYLSPGCQDIDECVDPSINLCEKMCINIPRSYDCCCPEGYTGDGKKNGCGCIAPSSKFPLIKFTLEGGVEETRIFTAEELKKATNNYANDGILGRGGNGIVYRGFINEIATTLAYLHSFASMPIIHRDVKSANILLDNVYTAKVADFGASRLIPLDQKHVATLVLGTSGYLGPEYFRTSQLIEKSDVYRFGVVLAELLTGLKPIIKARNEDKNLADYFVLSMNKNSLFHIIGRRVLREGSLEQLQKMGELVKNCLRPHGEDRPTMKEVAIELEGLRKMTGDSWSNQHRQEENDQDELSDLYTVQINSYGNTPKSDSSRIMHHAYSPS
ncbi:hypothetical protein P3S68_030350 [Capsicum galapagoense]